MTEERRNIRQRLVLAFGAVAAVLLTLTQPYGPIPSTVVFLLATGLVAVSFVALALVSRRRVAPVEARAPTAPAPVVRDDDEYWSHDC